MRAAGAVVQYGDDGIQQAATGTVVTVTLEELVRARGTERMRLGVANERPVKCCNAACGRLIGEGLGKQVYIDGQARGVLCIACQWGTA